MCWPVVSNVAVGCAAALSVFLFPLTLGLQQIQVDQPGTQCVQVLTDSGSAADTDTDTDTVPVFGHLGEAETSRDHELSFI